MELPESMPAEPDLPEEDPEAVLALSLKMIDELPEIYRQALLQTEYQGLSQKQLAANLGISLSGAKSLTVTVRTLVEGANKHAGPHPVPACLSYASRRDRSAPPRSR